jgi:predicted CxxxxCH...CXXCH cytochrome family protein
MKRNRYPLILLLFLLSALFACSSPNSQAPAAGQVHGQKYLLLHAIEAEQDLAGCKSCHGSDLDGINTVTSCLTCHQDGEPITIHAHPYSDPSDHGAAARSNLRQCFTCHGSAPNHFDGGILSDPALFNAANANCSAAGCHSDAGAHPTRWQGSNDNTSGYESSHRIVSRNTIDTSCAMCHQVTVDGPQPNNDAPSCFSASFTNSDGSTTGCHAGGPAWAHDLPFDTPDLHGADAKADLAACQTCHGTPGTTNFDGGTSDTSCAACHPDAGAHPTRWQGGNDNTADYVSSHRNAGKQSTTCAICHDVVEGNTAPNANAPSCYSASFTNADGSTTGCHASGPGAPHPVPYDDPLQHGADAKDNLSSCVPCHATPADAGAGDNPRFNVAIGDLANGCEDCHAANTAHPTPLWIGAAANSHSTAARMATACALCHGTGLDGPAGGGSGPACTDCHTAGSPLTQTNCTSCHNWPPDGQAPAGDQYPNRDGAHAVHNALAGVNGNCGVCHEGAGTESALHFNGGSAADVSLASTYNAQSGAASYNSVDKTCGTTRCHGGQTTPHWFDESIDVASECQECHSTSSGQYNGATSGEHRKHVLDEGMSCTDCHDPTLVATDHFRNLASTGFEGDPGETLNASLGYNPSTRRGCDVGGCHGTEEW